MAGASKPVDVSTKQQRIALLARQSPEMGFTSLAHSIDMGAIAPVPRVSARFLWFSSMTSLESATSARGSLEFRGALPVK